MVGGRGGDWEKGGEVRGIEAASFAAVQKEGG